MTDDSLSLSCASASKTKKYASLSNPAIRKMLLVKSALEIIGMALDWLKDINEMKAKSGHLRGRLSANMRKIILCLHEGVFWTGWKRPGIPDS